MDPVVAFSLAGTVLQFVDFGSKFVGLAFRLYQQGADATDLFQIQKLTENLDAILPKLKSREHDGDIEKSLGELALDCGKTATRLLVVLQKLNIAGKARKRDVLKAAFRSIYKEDEIKSLQDQLSSFRNQLNLHLLLSLREHVSRSTEQQEVALRKLGVFHDQTLSVGDTILRYLVSRGRESRDCTEDIEWLRVDLVGKIAQSLFVAELQYDGMIDRQSRIATAHESTLQWILQDNQSQDHQPPVIRWSNFRKWLESDDQLYWITGKAGSGKSTLIKFLCSPTVEMSPAEGAQEDLKGVIAWERCRCRCHPHLEEWAGPARLVVASFYFWNSGMELQMTQDGLLRTLLYQIVVQRPDILPIIAPKQWESLCLFYCTKSFFLVQDLHDMLFQAIKTLSNDSKICLFVDGLDEFGHSHEDLIVLVKDLIGGNGHVKVCVASRPWNVFQTALGQRASLRLEDLTFNDIKSFVQSKFLADTEFENLRRRYPQFADQLMDNIVMKASGVFLWVDLVVASLLAGMRLGDRIQDFQRRLDELPPDLENLYEKILHSLDQFHLEHAAQYFTLVESAEAPLTILQFSLADEESPESAIKMPLGSMTEHDISLRIEAVNRRINSRCKGFLETNRGLQGIHVHDKRRPSQVTVQYLHRTVRDFIKSPKAQNFLQSLNSDFDPSIQLCLAYLMEMKAWQGRQENEELWSIANVIHCFRRAAGVTEANGGATIELLEELKSVISQPYCRQVLSKKMLPTPTKWSDPGTSAISRPGPGRFQVSSESLDWTWTLEICKSRALDESFLFLAAKYDVVPYVRARAGRGALIQQSMSDTRMPLLLYALSGDVPEPKMVECLLDLGADPNFKISKVDSQTPWITALTKVTLLYTLRGNFGSSAEYLLAEDKWKQTLRLMFSRGADCTEVPDSLLTPISRKILQDLRNEVETKAQSLPSQNSWPSAWDLMKLLN